MRSSLSAVSNIRGKLRSPTGRVAKLAKGTVKRLTEQDAVISALLENAPAGMALLDRELTFIRINEAFAAINGAPVDAHLGRHLSEMVPDGWLDIESSCRRALDGETMRNVEAPDASPGPAGERRLYRINCFPVRVREQVVAIGISVLGVTAEMRGQREARSPWEAIFQSSMEGILLLDGSQRIQRINPAAERMFGLQSSSVPGQFLRTVLPVRVQRAVAEEMRVLIRRRSPQPRQMETTGRRSNGEEFPIQLVLAKVPAQEGDLFIAMVRDGSKYRLLEQQVLNAAEEAHKTIARELHDSLGSMLTATQIRAHVLGAGLRRAGLDGASGEAGELSQQLCQVIKQLRILVHGLHPLDIGPAWLMEGMRGLAERVRNTGRMKVRLLLPQQPVNLPAEFALHLHRIAEEATHNALRHSEAANLTLSFKAGNGEFVLRVSDNGRGFDPAGQGDGHGLLTMRYRAQSMGGRLILKARPGAGAKVICVIPAPGRETAAALTRATKPGG